MFFYAIQVKILHVTVLDLLDLRNTYLKDVCLSVYLCVSLPVRTRFGYHLLSPKFTSVLLIITPRDVVSY